MKDKDKTKDELIKELQELTKNSSFKTKRRKKVLLN